MILTDEELEAKLSSPSNLLNQVAKDVEVQRIENNRKGVGDGNIPPLVRSLIAGVAHSSDETQKEIAKTFGVDNSSVSKISRGLVSSRKDDSLMEVIGGTKERLESAHDLAVDALVNSLATLNNRLDQIEKPEKLAAVAERMSKIVDNLSGSNREENERTVKVILMAPVQRTEKYYEMVEV